LFSRSKSTAAEASLAELAAANKTGGKGRATPTRKEAEAAAKARAKVPRTRKEQAAQQRAGKTESSAKVRAGMKSGDERYLLARDKGPVRRFCRDYVDSRFTVLELAIPLLVVALVLGYAGAPVLSESIMLATILALAAGMVVLRHQMRKEVTRRFSESDLRGLTYYTLSRASQMRFMRMPKAKAKRGDVLPETYR
jgi:hypothetical protein